MTLTLKTFICCDYHLKNTHLARERERERENGSSNAILRDRLFKAYEFASEERPQTACSMSLSSQRKSERSNILTLLREIVFTAGSNRDGLHEWFAFSKFVVVLATSKRPRIYHRQGSNPVLRRHPTEVNCSCTVT